MNLTDWTGLAGNALWIGGLAVLLATLSMVRFKAIAGEESLCHRLARREPLRAIAVGLILCFGGLLACSGTWWERGLWVVAVALGVAWLVHLWRRMGADRGEDR